MVSTVPTDYNGRERFINNKILLEYWHNDIENVISTLLNVTILNIE